MKNNVPRINANGRECNKIKKTTSNIVKSILKRFVCATCPPHFMFIKGGLREDPFIPNFHPQPLEEDFFTISGNWRQLVVFEIE